MLPLHQIYTHTSYYGVLFGTYVCMNVRSVQYMYTFNMIPHIYYDNIIVHP